MRLSSAIILSSCLASTGWCWEHASGDALSEIIEKNELAESCETLESEWSIAAESASIPLLSIDCNSEPKFCSEHDVALFPAIRLYHDVGQVTRYRGERTASSISAFVQRSSRPVISVVDVNNLTEFQSIDTVVFILVIPNPDHEVKATFTRVATQYHSSFSFGVRVGPPNYKAHVLCYKSHEDELEVFTGPLNPTAIEGFVKEASLPLVGQLTRRNEMKYLKSGKSLVYIFANTDASISTFKTEFTPLAKKFKEYLSFVTIDAREYGHMLETLGLQKGKLPAAAVYNPSFGQMFPFDQEIEVEPKVIDAFVIDIVQGIIKPWGSSEEKEDSGQQVAVEERQEDGEDAIGEGHVGVDHSEL
ncbi:thioredoxin-like domain-containing protein [Amylocarpus encephaloides]|uniref:Thioredoxin-like domain-containing protein n=1 Tax=Amylocarpus encephaloides TaxID=45428 RepID=A0A9P7YUN8_9HELO|nr:thioredoxin-like domain-containing protein [Amylocarpus encephaloides]